MKKWIKITIWIIGTPIVLLGGLLLAYIIVNKQGVTKSFQVGNQNAKYKLLIASQGSEFKESLVNKFVEEFKSDSLYISVIDCTHLNDLHIYGWDAYIIVHTMQIHKMPEESDIFLHKLNDLTNVTLVSTSGAGDEHYKKLEIDGISSASRMVAIDPILKWVKPRVLKCLTKKVKT